MKNISERINDYFFLLTSENCADFQSALSGYVIYNNNIYNRYDLALEGMKEHDRGKGMYTLIFRKGNKIHILRDEKGSMQLYLFQKEDYWALSNSFWNLCEEVGQKFPLHLNVGYAECLYAFSMMPYIIGDTLCEEVSSLSVFAEIEVDCESGGIIVTTPDALSKRIKLDSPEGMSIVDRCISDWGTIIKSLDNGGWNICVHLSGGFDSRISFAVAKKAGVDFQKENVSIYSVVPKNVGAKAHFAGDYEIASDICEIYGLSIDDQITEGVGYKNISVEDRWQIYRNTLSNGVIQAFDRKILYNKPMVMWTGHMGESVRAFRYGTDAMIKECCVRTPRIYDLILPHGNQLLFKSFERLKQLTNDNNLAGDACLLRNTLECYDEVFFGKQFQQYYFTNVLVLSQFFDISLRQLFLEKEEDLNIIFAVILLRTCPELLDIPYVAPRKFSDETIKEAQRLCEKYPSKVTIDKESVIKYSSEWEMDCETNDIGKGDVNTLLFDKFSSEHTRNNIEKKMGDLGIELYDRARERYQNKALFHSETYMSGIVAISDMIDIEKRSSGHINFYNNDGKGILSSLVRKYPDNEAICSFYDDYLGIYFMHNTYIYGAGDFGRRLYQYLKRTGKRTIKGFVQSKAPTQDLAIDGLRVMSIDDIMPETDVQILIAINDMDAVSDICSELEIRGYKYEIWSGFIRENLMGGHYFCPVCGRNVSFSQGGLDAGIYNKKHVIGGGLRDHCICSFCGSPDRIRWFYFVIKKYTNILNAGGGKILHFAPEPAIEKKIRPVNPCYVTADLTPDYGDVTMDITDIRFRDDSFDYVIANHVLEHIPDEAKAITEMKRVLKPEGHILLSFPINVEDPTDEAADVMLMTSEERLERFGQEDHVRLYGKNYKERLERYGLEVKILSPKDICTKDEIERFGFIPDDVMLLCRAVEYL